MPPRPLTAVIILSWLAVTGWAVWRAAQPYLNAGEPPPYVIDLADESGHQTIMWRIFQNAQEVGQAETEVREDQGGLFRLESRYRIDLVKNVAKAEVTNRLQVTRAGDLHAVWAEVKVGHAGASLDDAPLQAQLEGPVRDGALHASGAIDLGGRHQKVAFDPVDVPGRASVLNPMHPVHKITGLKPGRAWHVPLFNPLALALTARIEGPADPLVNLGLNLIRNQGDAKLTTLSAEVLAEPQSLRWDRQIQECFVIEYRGEDHSARTWVRCSDGLVLRQEARLRGDTVMLVRVPQH